MFAISKIYFAISSMRAIIAFELDGRVRKRVSENALRKSTIHLHIERA